MKARHKVAPIKRPQEHVITGQLVRLFTDVHHNNNTSGAHKAKSKTFKENYLVFLLCCIFLSPFGFHSQTIPKAKRMDTLQQFHSARKQFPSSPTGGVQVRCDCLAGWFMLDGGTLRKPRHSANVAKFA